MFELPLYYCENSILSLVTHLCRSVCISSHRKDSDSPKLRAEAYMMKDRRTTIYSVRWYILI